MTKNIYGLYAGEVVSLKDPEHRGRIKVKIAELLGTVTSAWCEPCVPCCFENGGDFCLPELKDYVWVTFVNGDIERPVYLGGWWTKDSSPLGKTYENKSDLRIISFGNMSITMNADNDTITLKTSNEDNTCELKIAPTGVSVNGRNL